MKSILPHIQNTTHNCQTEHNRCRLSIMVTIPALENLSINGKLFFWIFVYDFDENEIKFVSRV